MKKLLLLLTTVIAVEINAGIIFADGKLDGTFKYGKSVEFEGNKVIEVNMNGWGAALVPQNKDWSSDSFLDFSIYSDRPGVELMVTINLAKKGSYYFYRLKITRKGWNTFSIPLKRFNKSRKPSGFGRIVSVGFCPKGWNLKPDPKAKVYIKRLQTRKKKISLKTTPVPINIAESIICPLWDKHLSIPEVWKAMPKDVYCKSTRNKTDFRWQGKIRLFRPIDLDCGKYDSMLFSMTVPQGTTLRFNATGDNGRTVSHSFKVTLGGKMQTTEYALPLKGLKKVSEISIELDNPAKSYGYIKWLGLRNSTLMKALESHTRKMRNLDLSKFVSMPLDGTEIKPGMNIFCDTDRIVQIRKEIADNPEAKKFLDSMKSIQLKKPAPEQRWREHVTFDKRWSRDRDYAEGNLIDCVAAAWAGVLLEDKKLMMLAARRAIVLAMVPNWGAGIYTSLPGTSWEHRAFDESNVVMELVFTLDFCYDYFTPAGKALIMRSIAQKGIGSINFVIWKWNYIFNCNQLAAFSRARVAAYIAMEKYGWNRNHIKPYTDLAIKELNENMRNVFAEDGGYSEGPGYYQYTLLGALPAYYCYARARKKKFADVLPVCLKNAGNFAELACSTDKHQAFIPFNDSGDGVYPGMVSFMALMLPESQFVGLYNHYLEKVGAPKLKYYWNWINGYVKKKPNLPHRSFILIPSMGSMASLRKLDDKLLKIAFMADTRRDAHKHRDAGQFIIELAGETLAMDSGFVHNYASTAIIEMQSSSRHNVMVPLLADGSFGEQNWIKHTLKMNAEGNKEGFKASVDLSPCWTGFFDKRVRKLSSASPSELLIEDEWKIKKDKAAGVAFLWLTTLKTEVNKRVVTISGEKASASFHIPDDWKYKVETLNREDNKSNQYRLSLRSDKMEGKLKLEVVFSTIKNTVGK